MLAIPDETVHRTKLADWLEFKAISSPDGRVGFGTFVSAVALAENEQAENIADEDTKEEDLVQRVQSEIERRLKTVGPDYPFRIDEKGHALHLVSPISEVGSIYLFCLFVSHGFDRTILPKALAPKITNRVRDLFQACATLAAGGFVEGPSMSFGFPRPDGTIFLNALKRIYLLFGDGKPRKQPRPSASQAVKDNGVDVIAWKRSIDNLPCTLYLIAQVASGNDWTAKSVGKDREHFHKFWFDVIPASQPHDAMFMPFGLEPEVNDPNMLYEDVLTDYMQNVGYKYGTLFYRDRIAGLSARGLQLVSNGELQIERAGDVAKVVKWVEEYTQRLRAA